MASFRIFLVSFALTAFKYCAPTFLYFQIEISNFLPEKILNYNRKKIHGRSCTLNWPDKHTVQLNGFVGRTFYFYNVSFSKCNFTCAFICFFICQYACFILLFSTLNISQGFSLNFARTLKDAQLTSCWMVQGLLHTGSLF